MSSLLILAPDNYVTCPYDPTHRILWQRFPLHLIKCRKQHVFAPLLPCPFDTKHQVPQEEMHFHMFMCEAKSILGPDISSNVTQQKSLEYKLPGPESEHLGSAEKTPKTCAPTPGHNQVGRKISCQLKTDKTLTNLDTLRQHEKEELWDEDVHKSGIVVPPFRFGERTINPNSVEYQSHTFGTKMTPLRQPLDVVHITESRQARNPTVYSYAMNSVGIGRGRGKKMTTSESCDSINLSTISQIGSTGVGRARNKILH